jgi:cold shock protein
VTTDTTTRHQGVVRWFSGNFGFIAQNAGGADMYTHITAVQRSGLRTLNEGDRIEYSVETDPKNGKPPAVDLRLI